MLLGAGGGVFVAKKAAATQASEKSGEETSADQSESSENPDAHAKQEKPKSKKKSPAVAHQTQVIQLGEFLLNVNSQDRLRYVKCEIAIEVAGLDNGKKKKKGHGEDEESPLTPEQEARAKDMIIRVFAETPFEQLRSAQGLDKLRKRLAEALDEVLIGIDVVGVLFTKFVMQ